MNILLVEDEQHTAALLKDIIEENDSFFVVEIVESIVDAVDYLIKYQKNLDLLFFDIQLSDGLSFEIFKHVDINTPVVFCTAYDDYAMDAIKNSGIDYVLKPFKSEDIHNALTKYQKFVGSLQSKTPIDFKQNKVEYQRYFLCQFKQKTIVVKREDIAYFSIENEITYLHSFESKRYPIFKNLEHIESATPPKEFFRINRQMLLNRNAVESYEPYFNRKIVLNLTVKTEDKPVVSRLKVSEFKKWLEQ
jgi:DNA-binding LytR/AlgR family response regulator